MPRYLRAMSLVLMPTTLWVSAAAAQDSHPGTRAPAFVRSPQTFEPMGANELFLEDLDGDGDTDAVISVYGTSLVLKNDGSGRFSEARRIETVHGLWVGDMDGDGDPDLVVAPQGRGRESCDLLLNDGRGEFHRRDVELCGGVGPYFFLVEISDIDGDGKLDVIQSRHDGAAFMWANSGGGSFERRRVEIPPFPSYADLNGDGWTDILSRESATTFRFDSVDGRMLDLSRVSREGETGVRTYLNDGSGHFERHAFASLSPLTAPGKKMTFFADIDGDGDRDVLYTDGPGSTLPVGVLEGDGTGRFTRREGGMPAVENGRIAAGDLNNDGSVDLVITDYERPAQIWMNDGTGAFRDSGVRLGERFGSQSLGVADLDGDGDVDIFITDYQRSGTSVWLNQLVSGSGAPEGT